MGRCGDSQIHLVCQYWVDSSRPVTCCISVTAPINTKCHSQIMNIVLHLFAMEQVPRVQLEPLPSACISMLSACHESNM